MPIKNVLRPVALAAAVALGAAACGGGGDGGGGDDGGGGGGGGRVDGTLKLGYVLPETGQLAFLGDPQIAATQYGINQINEAGGVLGEEIPEVVASDEAGDEAVANQSASRVINENADAIIGAAASGMTGAIVDSVTGAGVLQCSGSNTSAALSDVEDNGFYFRTSPSDELQGVVLAETVIADGHTNVAVVGRADDYGQGLVEQTAAALEEAGATVATQTTYDPNAQNFDAPVQEIASAEPDAAVLVSFEEGVQILQGMIEAGVGPQDIGVYGADGLAQEDLASSVSEDNPGVLAGMKGTAPGANNPEFFDELNSFQEDLDTTQFAPEVFDCVTLIGLGAVAAETDDPAQIKEQIVGLTKDGEKCESFGDCKSLLEEGTDIDYDGVSGPLEFNDIGEPTVATYRVYSFNDEGEFAVDDYVQSELSQ